MLFRLARLWGWPNPDVLADYLTPEMLTRWMAYDIVEPFGNEWEMHGTVAAAVTNALRAYMMAKAGRTMSAGEHETPDAFIPRPAWWRAPRVLSDEECESEMMRMVMG